MPFGHHDLAARRRRGQMGWRITEHKFRELWSGGRRSGAAFLSSGIGVNFMELANEIVQRRPTKLARIHLICFLDHLVGSILVGSGLFKNARFVDRRVSL